MIILQNETHESIDTQQVMQSNLKLMQRNMDKIQMGMNNVGGLVNLLASWAGVANWWPFIACPVASILAGSYQLKPSVRRNLGLLILGKALGTSAPL